MWGSRVMIERFIDEAAPGWVECSFVDARGCVQSFNEKAPVVTSDRIDARSEYPCEGIIGCIVIGTRLAADGRELVLVDTGRPWGIESKAGQIRFEVFREQVLELDDEAG